MLGILSSATLLLYPIPKSTQALHNLELVMSTPNDAWAFTFIPFLPVTICGATVNVLASGLILSLNKYTISESPDCK